MRGTRQFIPILGLLVTMGWASHMVVQIGAQEPTVAVDFSNAVFAEVRDPQGQVVLRGEFVQVEDDDDVERKAVLAPTGVDRDAVGEVEIELSRPPASDEQEIELSVMHVQPGVAFTFAIDGQNVATVTADRRGRIELERNVRSGRLQ